MEKVVRQVSGIGRLNAQFTGEAGHRGWRVNRGEILLYPEFESQGLRARVFKQILNYKSELANNPVENGRESRSLNQQQYEKRGKGATDEPRRLSKEDLRTSSTCRWEKERWERKHRQCRLVERGRKGGRKRQSAQTMTCLLKTSRLPLPPCMQYS